MASAPAGKALITGASRRVYPSGGGGKSSGIRGVTQPGAPPGDVSSSWEPQAVKATAIVHAVSTDIEGQRSIIRYLLVGDRSNAALAWRMRRPSSEQITTSPGRSFE
jgi:hypothetical protein